MVKSRRELLANAFQPGKELDDATLFSGRKKQIGDLADALHMKASCPLIYGDRGIGKTSLALQLRQIALGNNELLERLGLANRFIDRSNSYLCVYVTCSDMTQSTMGVLDRVSLSLRSLRLENTANGTGGRLVDWTTSYTATLKFISRRTEKRYTQAVKSLDSSEYDHEGRIIALAREITEATGQRVLIILDELDRVSDTSGFASFIKNASSEDLKFMLVGIAHNVSNLVQGHLSIQRMMHPVQLERMTTIELRGIVHRAEKSLKLNHLALEFQAPAVRLLASLAQGYPWFVHVIGQSALLIADDHGAKLVDPEHVRMALFDLVDNRFAQQFADLYQQAVKNSVHREKVLRTFSKWTGRDIPTSEVYPVLKRRLGVPNPSVYRRHLLQQAHGSVLVSPPHQSRGLVRFSNEMFKAYVRIVPSLYDGVDRAVSEAWEVERP